MAMNKKKTTTAIVAGVTAVALLLGGTFAWTSISQRALNEAAGIVNVGGRLHDDFDGTNKDVYVENFTDPLNGGQPIYARIRLDEYMEVGSEAGKYDAESNSYVADRNAKPVVDGTDIADVSTWTTHVPTTACTVCATSASCAIHDHWKWTMGNTEAKYFMPTFNKDKDSLDADVNGTYHGKDDTDKVYYDDYVEYVKDQTVTKDAYYDDDTDTRPNVHEPLAGAIAKQETHTAKLTGTATVITMEEFLDPNGNNGAPGNFWVYDTDGWAYWANPIMPGESTGFLLDSIKMEKNPGEKCYYAINVVAQFATVGDWEYFEDKEGNLGLAEDSNALKVMQAAAANVPTVTVSSDSTVVAPGQTAQFSATVSQGQVAGANDPAVEWSLYNADGSAYTGASSINASGLLTVAKDEAEGTILTVVARSTEYLGAVGMKSVSVKTPDIEISISATNKVNSYISGQETKETFAVSVTGDDAVGGTVSWKLLDKDGSALTESSIVPNGNTADLTIGTNETSDLVLIEATYTSDKGYSAVVKYTISKIRFTTTDDLSARAYVLIQDDGSAAETYKATFIRTYDALEKGMYYDGAEIVDYFLATEEDYGNNFYDYYARREWAYTYSENLTSVKVANTLQPKSLCYYFRGKTNLKSLDLSKLDASVTTSFRGMFMECSSLESIILPDGFGKNATTMRSLFADMTNLKTVTFEGSFGGNNLTNISDLFSGCEQLMTIDLSKMTVSQTEGVDVSYLVHECVNLTTLSLPENLKISSLSRAFWCNNLESVSGLNTWDVSDCGDSEFSYLFYTCNKLERLDLTGWNLGKATDIKYMFRNCYELSEIVGAASWNTSNVTDMKSVFDGCSKLTLDCSNWNVDNVTSYYGFNDDAPSVIAPTWKN